MGSWTNYDNVGGEVSVAVLSVLKSSKNHQKIGNGCQNQGKTDKKGPSLDMESFGGIYLILRGGVALSLFSAVCEILG